MKAGALCLLAATALGCQSTAPAPEAPAAALDAPGRVARAGRANARAAYTAYAISLFDLQLLFAETLPEAWFPGTLEFAEGVREIAEVTALPPSMGTLEADLAAFDSDARRWREWYVNERPKMSEAQQTAYDALFGRLEGTSPFLNSSEFRDVVRSLGRLSGLDPSWDSAEQYQRWSDFDSDRQRWRRWFEDNRATLEWGIAEHHLVRGRGLPVSP